MKYFVFALLALTAAGSFAGNGFERMNVDFSSAMDLDDEMKSDLKEMIALKCQPKASEAKRINVYSKSVRYNQIDQGIIDTYHTVGIEFIGRDNYNSLGYEEALVVRYSGNNPTVDHVYVEKLTTNSACQ